MPLTIDYSQYKDWMFCPWYWYERHVLRRQRIRTQLRTDNMALGSLVHAGLAQWHKNGVPEIPQSEIDEIGPAPETLGEAQHVLVQYVQQYPEEPWSAVRLEAPLVRDYSTWRLLAKVDGYFTVNETISVPSGVDGGVLVLQPGIYGIEHKTKDSGIEIGKYMERWTVNRQADFQILALAGNMYQEYRDDGTIRGIVVNVIEKPKAYVPERQCAQCGQRNAMSMWGSAGEMFKCPVCGNVQVLKPYKPKTERVYRFWRMLVTRTPERLQVAEDEIRAVVEKMDRMTRTETGFLDEPPNTENCIQARGYTKCEYFAPHNEGWSTVEHSQFEDVPDYTGLRARQNA